MQSICYTTWFTIVIYKLHDYGFQIYSSSPPTPTPQFEKTKSAVPSFFDWVRNKMVQTLENPWLGKLMTSGLWPMIAHEGFTVASLVLVYVVFGSSRALSVPYVTDL